MFLSPLRTAIVTVLFTTSMIACGGSLSASARETKPVASEDESGPVAILETLATVDDPDRDATLVFVTTSDVAELQSGLRMRAQHLSSSSDAMGST